jgi:FMN phosphatase YigB (HAD superfamily)
MTPTAVFFDIGDTLAVPVFAPDNSLQAFEVFPFVLEILRRLKSSPYSGHPLRLGVISNTGTLPLTGSQL